DIGIVGNLDRVMISPPSSSGKERVRMVGIGEDQWVMPSMDNNPLYGGYPGVGGSVGVMGRVDVGHEDGAAVKGTPCTIGMAASNTATTTVIPTTNSVCCYMLSIGKAVREGDLPNSSTSVGRGMQETAPLLLEELNDARLNHTGGSSSSCYDMEVEEGNLDTSKVPRKDKEVRKEKGRTGTASVQEPPRESAQDPGDKDAVEKEKDYVSLDGSDKDQSKQRGQRDGGRRDGLKDWPPKDRSGRKEFKGRSERASERANKRASERRGSDEEARNRVGEVAERGIRRILERIIEGTWYPVMGLVNIGEEREE
ncbi:hypothetical protein FOZ63_013551, partial [Perkinsus olseni]